MPKIEQETLDLTRFCMPPYGTSNRYDVNRPWIADGKTYATNGCVLVECYDSQVTPEPATEGRFVNDPGKYLADFPDVLDGYIPTLQIPMIDHDCWWGVRYSCISCMGTGKHQCDCEYCKKDCEKCLGEGGYMDLSAWAKEPITIDGSSFRQGNLFTVSELPEVRVKCVAERMNGELEPKLYFTFRGGRGVLLGLGVPES